MGTTKSRSEKIKFFKDTLEAFFNKHPEGTISRDKLIAQFIIKCNSTYRTGAELMDVLAFEGKYVFKGDNITK